MSQYDYNNIPVISGQPAPAAGTTAGFYQPAPQPESSGLLATDQARAIAEVKAALVIAASRPRNELQARDRLLQACQRRGLAESAIYQYTRGGSAVSGPSIRLAESAARAWGNMTYGFRELSRGSGVSECEAYAWDLETNTKAVRQFSVRHRRNTRKGGYDLTDERDIYELMANQAQRRVRAAILEIIPGDIIEDAVRQCEITMQAQIGDLSDAVRALVETFARMGVSREAIEKRLGHRVDSMQPAQVLSFRKIYTSIKDGMSDPGDWFDLEEQPKSPEAAAPAPAPVPAIAAVPAAAVPEAPEPAVKRPRKARPVPEPQPEEPADVRETEPSPPEAPVMSAGSGHVWPPTSFVDDDAFYADRSVNF